MLRESLNSPAEDGTNKGVSGCVLATCQLRKLAFRGEKQRVQKGEVRHAVSIDSSQFCISIRWKPLWEFLLPLLMLGLLTRKRLLQSTELLNHHPLQLSSLPQEISQLKQYKVIECSYQRENG